MEIFISFIEVFGMGILGISLYAVVSVWKKIRQDGFNAKKFFNDNKKFWIWGLVLHFLVSLVTIVVPDAVTLLQALGFAVEGSSSTGWILFGITLGSGTNNTNISGLKKLGQK